MVLECATGATENALHQTLPFMCNTFLIYVLHAYIMLLGIEATYTLLWQDSMTICQRMEKYVTFGYVTKLSSKGFKRSRKLSLDVFVTQ